jgi:hypothetical protein
MYAGNQVNRRGRDTLQNGVDFRWAISSFGQPRHGFAKQLGILTIVHNDGAISPFVERGVRRRNDDGRD